MKEVLTAIGIPTLNEKLRKEDFIEIKYKDIQYKEALLEILEENKNIDLIIINETLPGEINLIELLKKIKNINEKIEIIIILEKENIILENELKKINIFNIYLNNKININKLINIIKEKEINNEEELKKEIKKLKEIIKKNNIKENKIIENTIEKNKIKNKLEKNINFNKNIINKLMRNIKNNSKFNSKQKDFINENITSILQNRKNRKRKKIKSEENKVDKSIHNTNAAINILGSGGVGKSIVCLVFAQCLVYKKENVAIFIFDSEDALFYNNYKNNKNNTLNKNIKEKVLKSKKIYKRKKVKNFQNKFYKNKIRLKKIKNKKFKIKINSEIIKNKIQKNKIKNINIINCTRLIKNKKNIFNINYLKKIIKYYKKNNIIIFDTKNNLNKKIKKIIIKNAEKNYLIFEPNLIGIKKAKKEINEYTKELKTNINLIINKNGINSINTEILENIFENIKIKIIKNNYFEKLINNNFRFKKLEFLLKTRLIIKNINK